MAVEVPPRRYRFAPLHRAGLFGAVPPTLLVTLATGVIASWLAVLSGAPLPIVVVPLMAAGAVGFGRVHGQPLHELGPHAVAWWWKRLRRRHSWLRPVPLTVDGTVPQPLPASLAGLELFDADPPVAGSGRVTGIVHDRTTGVVTAVLRVTGDGDFALADPNVQDSRVELWGQALAGFCREASPVVRVAWHDWTSPTGVTDHVADVRARWVDEPETSARAAYLTLVKTVAPTSIRHEVLVTVTVDLRRVRRGRRRALDVAVETLLDEVRLFAGRLDNAGLHVDPPLSAAGLVTAVRSRSDPGVLAQLAVRRRSLAAAADRAAPDFGPVAVAESWRDVRVDGAVHRSWWFARWPRREVPAGWLDHVLFGIHTTRTVTVVYEPIAPSRSDRDIDKESVARQTNAQDKARHGFRVRAADRKAHREVQLREAELNDGYSELAYIGLLTVTADDPAELDDVAGVVEQTAAQAGIQLHPLYARQAAGWVASLPLGRTLARKVTP